MQREETQLPGVFILGLAPVEDERGAFIRLYDRERFEQWGLPTEFSAAATSVNPRSGTLRGLHYQAAPHGEHKLIRCVRGRSYHVALDVRHESPAFGQWMAIELEPGRPQAICLPPGVAHGVQTGEPDTEILYLLSGAHMPEAARGVRFDDPAFAITWPAVSARVISPRDRSYPDFT